MFLLSGYGINGNNKIQIMLPNMLAQIPVHSALGGKKIMNIIT